MSAPNIDSLVVRLESYLECWKQFSHYINQGRTKEFTHEDETQFLELKSVLTQELELILSAIDCGSITREEVHALLAAGPSLRFVSELNDNAFRSLENSWHRLYISLQSVLGQLKVRQQQSQPRGFFSSLFGRSRAA